MLSARKSRFPARRPISRHPEDGFFRSLWVVKRSRGVKPPFDISGDLDTPVSAYMKLSAFAPRFLLESVEGGERLARYSFIGFGDGLEGTLCRHGFMIGRERRPVPRNSAELLGGMREALRLAPHPQPDIDGVPLA